MHIQDIEARLRDFIDTTAMGGQGADLTSSTPLLELGILDSFAVFSLMTFIEKEMGVPLQFESVTADDFHSIATIARLVHTHLAAPPIKAAT
jgi:acyl carrier protein